MVNPYPPLTVAVSAKPGTTTPGSEVLLMIRVTNGTDLISGANLTPTSTTGGSFSGLTDNGNGNYTLIYTAPIQRSTYVVKVEANKTKLTKGQGQGVVKVTGILDLRNVKVGGLRVFLFVEVEV